MTSTAPEGQFVSAHPRRGPVVTLSVLAGLSPRAVQSIVAFGLVGVAFLILVHGTGGRVRRWLGEKPGRVGLIWYPSVGW